MATDRFTFTAPVRWAKVFEQNRDLTGYKPKADKPGTYEDFGGAYTIVASLTDEDVKAYEDLGGRAEGKADDDGIWYKFKRRHEDKFDWASGPPKLLKKDGTAWSLDEDGWIGNDSICEITVTIYDTATDRRGTRLESVKVLDLVRYEKEEVA